MHRRPHLNANEGTGSAPEIINAIISFMWFSLSDFSRHICWTISSVWRPVSVKRWLVYFYMTSQTSHRFFFTCLFGQLRAAFHLPKHSLPLPLAVRLGGEPTCPNISSACLQVLHFTAHRSGGFHCGLNHLQRSPLVQNQMDLVIMTSASEQSCYRSLFPS